MPLAVDQTNLAGLLERQLPHPAYELARAAAREAEAAGMRAFLVGGLVRDLLLGRPSLDIDIVVEGDAGLPASALAARVGGSAVTHPRFGTAKVRSGDLAIDLATARTETYAHPGALPSVKPGTIGEDLFRRDFTVNAIAASMAEASFGEVLDPLDGRRDLDAGELRVMHGQSFVDDATRILRAFRYQARFGMRLEAQTAGLLREGVPHLGAISADRRRHELERIFEEDEPERALDLAGEAGVLAAIHPALVWREALSDAFAAARREGKATPGVYLAIVGSALEATEVTELETRLALPRALARPLLDAQRLQASLAELERPGMRRSEVYDALSAYDDEAIAACRFVCDSRIINERLRLYLDDLAAVRPILDGTALKNLGVPEGPSLGALIAELRRARLDGGVATRDDEAEFVRQWLDRRGAGE